MPGAPTLAVAVLRRVVPALAALLALSAGAAVAPAAAGAPARGAGDVRPQIVNGQPATAPVPWQAALVADVPSPDAGMPVFCGATVRDLEHVITAAHCIETVGPDDVSVAAGFVRRDAPGPSLQTRRVAVITSHPSYDPVTLDYDVAVIRLAEPLIETAAVRPLRVVDPGTPLAGAWGNISGWGILASGGPTPLALQWGLVRVLPDAQCDERLGPIFQPATMLCATDGVGDGVVDSCQGDSGGPLALIPDPREPDAAASLIGIVSFGIGCATPEFPGIYTRLAHPGIHALATDPDPRPRIEPLGPAAIHGDQRVGGTVTCDVAWDEEPLRTRTRWRLGPVDDEVELVRDDGDAIELPGSTLTLDDGMVGWRLMCAVTAVSPGGVRTVAAWGDGPIGPRLPAPRPPAPPALPAPPAPPPAPVPDVPPPRTAPRDLVPPQVRIARRACARRRCRLTIRAADRGGPATRATVRYRRLTGCPRGRRGRRCRRIRTVRARRIRPGAFAVVTPRLAAARWRFTVVATDAAGNRSRPVRVTLRVRRR